MPAAPVNLSWPNIQTIKQNSLVLFPKFSCTGFPQLKVLGYRNSCQKMQNTLPADNFVVLQILKSMYFQCTTFMLIRQMQPETCKITLNLVLITNKNSSSDRISGSWPWTTIKVPIPGIVQGQVGRGSEQHDHVEDSPARYSKVGPDVLRSPFKPKPF